MERFPITFRECNQAITRITILAEQTEDHATRSRHYQQLGLWKDLEDRILGGEQIFERPDDSYFYFHILGENTTSTPT